MKVLGWVRTNLIGSKYEFTVEINDDELSRAREDGEEANFISECVKDEIERQCLVDWGWTDYEKV